MTEALVKTEAPLTEEQIAGLLQMDINKLSMTQRSQYLYVMAKRAGLDPALKPFDMLPLGGKLILYANSSATDQLREIYKISIETLDEGALMIGTQVRDDVYVVRKKATIFDIETGTYRYQTDVGAIDIMGLKGESLANAIMKAHTKADRRVTLGIKGLGIPDVSELEAIPGGGGKEPLTAPRVITVTPTPAPEPPEQAQVVTNGNGKRKFPPAVAPVAG
jgi:hypothetical protein